MPLRDAAPLGAPCWVDVFTSDPDKSREFYGRLFGWTAEDPNEEFGGYFNFSKDGILVAGGMKNDGSTGSPDAWSVHLATDDAQATADAATANGGQVLVPPMAVGELGTMVLLTDTGGAAIGAWQPGLHKGFGILGEPGTPSWFELHTRDYDATTKFYRVSVTRRWAKATIRSPASWTPPRSCLRACPLTGRSTSASRTLTPRRRRSSNSAARSSCPRRTRRTVAWPRSPIRRARCSSSAAECEVGQPLADERGELEAVAAAR